MDEPSTSPIPALLLERFAARARNATYRRPLVLIGVWPGSELPKAYENVLLLNGTDLLVERQAFRAPAALWWVPDYLHPDLLKQPGAEGRPGAFVLTSELFSLHHYGVASDPFGLCLVLAPLLNGTILAPALWVASGWTSLAQTGASNVRAVNAQILGLLTALSYRSDWTIGPATTQANKAIFISDETWENALDLSKFVERVRSLATGVRPDKKWGFSLVPHSGVNVWIDLCLIEETKENRVRAYSDYGPVLVEIDPVRGDVTWQMPESGLRRNLEELLRNARVSPERERQGWDAGKELPMQVVAFSEEEIQLFRLTGHDLPVFWRNEDALEFFTSAGLVTG